MNLHEYQAKELLKKYNVPVQEGIACSTVAEAEAAYTTIKQQYNSPFAVIKAQIHAGGRGKGTVIGTEQKGVAVAKNAEAVKTIAGNLLGGTLVTIQTGEEGKLVNKILVAQDVYYDGPNPVKEFYLSVLMDREKCKNVIMYSTEGGMNIEDVAHDTPELIFKEWITPGASLAGYQARKIAFNLGLSGDAFKNCVKFVGNLYEAFVGLDCGMLEINPLFKTSDDKIIAVDCKMNIDDNALIRQKEVAALRDVTEEDPAEVEAGEYNLNFVKLDGNVGCMVNGAGLAMATMDMIKLSGGEPANFLDVGGGATAEKVTEAFKIMLKNPDVKGILVNIFGGIMKCDTIAEGVISACKAVNLSVPLVVRMKGTNEDLGKKMLAESGLPIIAADTMADAATKIVQAVSA